MSPEDTKRSEEPKGLLARFDPRRIHRGRRVSDIYLHIGAIALTGGLSFGLAATIMEIGRANIRKKLEEVCEVLARGDELGLQQMQAFHADSLPFLGPRPEQDNVRTLQRTCWRQGIDTSLGCIAQAIRRSATSVDNIPHGLIPSAQSINGPCGTEEDNQEIRGEHNLSGVQIH